MHRADAYPLCRDILPSDLQYLTDENIEEIGSTMTHVERMRMQAALQALRGACRYVVTLRSDLTRSLLCAAEAGTE